MATRSTNYSKRNGKEQQRKSARSTRARKAQPSTQLQTTTIIRIHKAKQPLTTFRRCKHSRSITDNPHPSRLSLRVFQSGFQLRGRSTLANESLARSRSIRSLAFSACSRAFSPWTLLKSSWTLQSICRTFWRSASSR
jgi:hypothetical protein